MKRRAVVVKVGSSTLVDGHGRARTRVFSQVATDVAVLAADSTPVVIVSSGAIALGLGALGVTQRPRRLAELQAASAVGQSLLVRRWERALGRRQARAAQVLLTVGDIHRRDGYLNARRTLETLLGWGLVPIVNENDSTATDEISFGDNDFLAAQVAVLLDARLLVLLTDIDGLHSADPRIQSDAELITEVEDFSQLSDLEIGDRTSAFGSGGMRSKVAAAEMASEAGIPAVICNGTTDDTLAASAAGEAVGTRFAAQPSKATSFKLWLKYAKPTRGRLTVDDGAARVLRNSGSSLLPVGIVGVEGEFDAGDAVEVAADGTVLGKGIVDYSSRELTQVIGLKSDAVRDLLPHAADEAIHRDRFVLL